MKGYVWKSSVAPMIKEYLDFKHLSGFKFEAQERCLRHFDHHFYYNGYEGKSITKEVLIPFLYEQDEAVSTICSKETLFLDFCRFLKDRGYHAYVIVPQYEFRRSHYIPHIYTKDECKRFLTAIESYPCRYSPNRKTIDRVMFRVIMGTGCRLSEILNLRISSFDRERRAITVLHAKNDRNRIVPLCDSLSGTLSDYIDTFHHNSHFRHTFATKLLSKTSSHQEIKAVAELLGDDYKVVIKTYLHTDEDGKTNLVDLLND